MFWIFLLAVMLSNLNYNIILCSDFIFYVKSFFILLLLYFSFILHLFITFFNNCKEYKISGNTDDVTTNSVSIALFENIQMIHTTNKIFMNISIWLKASEFCYGILNNQKYFFPSERTRTYRFAWHLYAISEGNFFHLLYSCYFWCPFWMPLLDKHKNLLLVFHQTNWIKAFLCSITSALNYFTHTWETFVWDCLTNWFMPLTDNCVLLKYFSFEYFKIYKY